MADGAVSAEGGLTAHGPSAPGAGPPAADAPGRAGSNPPAPAALPGASAAAGRAMGKGWSTALFSGFAGLTGQLSDRYAQFRNRLVAKPGFQRFAARNPLLRPVANARARALFDLTAGFVYSQLLSAVVRLQVLEALMERPADAAALGRRAGLEAEPMARLLEGAGALGLVEPAAAAADGTARWRLALDGAALLANPGAVAMIRHHDMLYRDLADPVALLRGETDPEIGRFWAYARDPGAEDQLAQGFGAEAVGAYSALMAASQQFIAEDVLDRLPLKRMRRLLDLGGGEGAFLLAAAARAPHLELRLLDLPAVAERARARFEAAGLCARAEAIGGDFFSSPLPEADTVSLVRVLYDHDDAFVRRLLARLHAGMVPGSRLIVAEPMAGLSGAERAGAYFTLYLTAMRSGRARSPADLSKLLEEAGFQGITRHRTARPLLCGLITARA